MVLLLLFTDAGHQTKEAGARLMRTSDGAGNLGKTLVCSVAVAVCSAVLYNGDLVAHAAPLADDASRRRE